MSINVTAIAVTSNVATLTTSGVHNVPLTFNSKPVVISVSGLSNTFLNGVWTLSNVTTNTLSFNLTHANVSNTGDTGIVIQYTAAAMRVSGLKDATAISGAARFLVDDPAKAGSEGASIALISSSLTGTAAGLSIGGSSGSTAEAAHATNADLATNATHATSADSATTAGTLSGTLAVNKGGSGAATLAAHSFVLGNGTSAVNLLTPTVADRIPTTNASGSDPTLTTVVQRKTSSPLAAGVPCNIWNGTSNPISTVGNLQTSEIIVISKGEPAGPGAPNWNTGGQNLLCFGHGCKLPNGIILTAYNRQTSEGLADGNSKVCYKISFDLGASWGPEISLFTASSGGSFNSLSNVTCWHNQVSGRTFIFYNIGNNGTSEVKGQLIWSDDPLLGSGSWSTGSPVTILDSNFSFQYYAVVDAMVLPNGDMLIFGYGKDTGDTFRTSTCLVSTLASNGAVWTRRSIITNGPSLSAEYIEPCGTFRADGSILVALRSNANFTNSFVTSTNSGNSWSAVAAVTLPGIGKPHLATMTNGVMVMITRSTNPLTFESCLFVCRDFDGTGTHSWGPEHDFDPSHGHYYYGALFEIAPNVLGCTFAGPIGAGAASSSDWLFTAFSDGPATMPQGSHFTRTIHCKGLAAWRQPYVTLPTPIAQAPTGLTVDQLAVKVNALIQQNNNAGIGFYHPADTGILLASWPTIGIPANTNDWNSSFARADSTTVVQPLLRHGGQTNAETQVKGTWGTISNNLYMSSTSGGTGYQDHMVWDMSHGDGIFTVAGTWNATCAVVLRWIDANNMIIGYIDGTNLTIYKVIAATATNITAGGSASLAISAGQAFILEVQAAGNLINIYTSVNGSALTTTPTATVTLGSGSSVSGDITTFANTHTSWGVMMFSLSTTTRFSSVTFTTTTFVPGDKFSEVIDYGGSAISLLQNSASHQMTLETWPRLYGGKPFASNSGGNLSLSTAAFASKNPPLTFTWIGALQQDPSTTVTLALIWDGVGTHFAQISVASKIITLISPAGSISAPAFTGYPYGPVIIDCEVNGANSKLFINGLLVGTGNLGSQTGLTTFQVGEASPGRYMHWLQSDVFLGIRTAKQAYEHGRWAANTYGIEGWNVRT